MGKVYSDTYLYRKYPEYDKKLFEFIMKAERIDANGEEFTDILYDIKRRNISDAIIKVLKSNNVVLGIQNGKSLPKALKVFVAKDVKEDRNTQKVFIDISDCVVFKNGKYTTNHIDWIISYLINAMVSFIYVKAETKLTNNSSVVKDGGEAFVKCFSYIIDRIYKISTVQSLRKRVEYIAALYYQINILNKDYSKNYDSIKATAMHISDVDNKDAQIVDIMLDESYFLDINHFTEGLNKIFKFKDLTVALILEKWMQAFGTGTVFALEYFPGFSMMLTNTYVGGYIDQQLSIEKITGQSMVKFTKSILQIGASVV